MKTKFLFFASIFLTVLNLQAQAPEKFNYQGIARDNTGAALANQALGLQISILNAVNTAVYTETHSVTTNDFGLYHIAIGNGTPVTGTMSGIDWAGGNKSIKVGIDPNGGTNYMDLGTTELLSVPYALYSMESDDSGNYTAGNGITMTGNSISADLGIDIDNAELQNDAVTSAKILDGEIATVDLADNAVTSLKIVDGTIATVDLDDNSVTASKLDAMGATADQVLKFDGTSWVPATDDSGTAYTAGTGIAISGANDISSTLGTDIDNAELQNDAVTTDKILDGTIAETDLVNDAVTSPKILDGTIATTDLANDAVTSAKILDGEIATVDLADNAVTSIKIDDGTIATTDLANSSVTASKLDAMGATADQVLKFDGTNWIPATDDPGAAGWELDGNIAGNTDFIGTTNNEPLRFKQNNLPAGYINSSITAFGQNALSSNTIGLRNTGQGYRALYSNITGNGNTAIGYKALEDNMISYNTAVGNEAMMNYSYVFGSPLSVYNTAIGSSTEISDGVASSTAIGNNATVTASNHIVLGDGFISQIGGYAPWSNLSDIRFKKDIHPQKHGLDFIMKLEPITYHVDTEKLHEFINGIRENKREMTPELVKRMEKKASVLQSGFSAQQVEEAAQAVGYDFSAVHKPENEKDHYTLAYAQFVVPLVKAVQEQQKMIMELKKESNKKPVDFDQTNLQEQMAINEKQKQKIKQLEEVIRKIQARLEALEY